MKRSENQDDIETIHDVNLFYERIEICIKGLTKKKFDENWQVRDAIRLSLYRLGRAISSLSDEFKMKYDNEIPFATLGFYGWDIGYVPDDEELYNVAKGKWEFDDDVRNIWEYREMIRSIYEFEFEGKEYNPPPVKKEKTKGKEDKLICTDYEYPIKTKSSLWTVGNKSKKG